MSWLSRLGLAKRSSPVTPRRHRRRRLVLETLESREVLHSPTRLKAVVPPTGPVPISVTGPTSPASPVEAPETPVAREHLVAGLYNDLLGREPSVGEVQGWANSLQSGASNGMVIQMFLGSAEYRTREIQGAYANLLSRPAEDAAQNFWLGQMQAGASYKTLLSGLLGSDEYFARHGDNSAEFVKGVYADLLYRAPEDGALDVWGNDLQGGMSRSTVVSAIMNSPEASSQFVDQAYHALLGRAPDSAALVIWGPAIQSGLSVEQLRLIVAGSSEYAGLQSGTPQPVIGLDWSTVSPDTPIAASQPITNSLTSGVRAIVHPTVDVNRQLGSQSEVAIGINPVNNRQMFAFANDNAAAANGMTAAYSIDGGLTWTSRVLGSGADGLPTAFSDPWVAWDTFGNLFISYIGFDANSNLICAVNFSTDGGVTFKTAGTFPVADHPEISVGADTVAVTFNDPSDNIVVFMAPVTGLGQVGAFQGATVPNSAAGNFGDIAIGPAGQIATVWQQATSDIGPDVISVSTDPDGLGSQSFTNPTTVTATNVGSFRPIAAQPVRTVLANASLAWDLSNGPHRGRLYISYCNAADVFTDDLNIFLRYSDDGGTTWSAPQMLNDDNTGRSQFFPRVAVDQTSGNVGVAWYDCRLDPGSGPFDTDRTPNTDVVAFGTFSTDGGASFSRNFQIATGPSNALRVPGENQGNDFGDYNGIAFANGKMFYGWTDNNPHSVGNPDLPNFDIATAESDIRVVLPQDAFELNDTSDKPTNFGFFAGNTTIKNLTIAGHADLLPDYDWYSFVTASTGTFAATITYMPNGGGDLNMRVFTVDANNTLIQLGASLAQGTNMQSVRVDVPAGVRLLVWVYGFNFAEGSYEMNLSL
jgi:hypothetical protein